MHSNRRGNGGRWVSLVPYPLTDAESFIQLAIQKGFGLSIPDFAYPDILDLNWKARMRVWQDLLAGFSGPVSVHGAYLDMWYASRDPRIVQVCRDRMELNLHIAQELKADALIFHASYNPLVKDDEYRKEWLQKAAQYWSDFLQNMKACNIRIVLENLWEPAPELLKQLVSQVNDPRFCVCLDVGHAHIFSQLPILVWVTKLRECLRQVHLNDNTGDQDSSLPIGRGSIDWKKVFEALDIVNRPLELVLEVSGFETTIESIEYLDQLGLLPQQS